MILLMRHYTSLFAAFKGTYNHKRLYIDVLSGSPEGKDPGNEYYECQFLPQADVAALNTGNNGPRRHFMPIQDLIKINPVFAASSALKKAQELKLTEDETARITDIYIRCATILGNAKSLQVITVDEDPSHVTPVEEILEIFVRVNSGGLVLQKSDLLMSLLDLTWNDIQPELQSFVKEINASRPFVFTRDDVLKSLLLAEGAETRFDKLVNDRKQLERLAKKLPAHIPVIKRAWQMLGVILQDHCRIHSERFFRGGHNALLPFVLFLAKREDLSNTEKRNIVVGIYLAIMSGVFSGAEARMGAFARNKVAGATSFPLDQLVAMVKREYGIKSLDDMLTRHLDLALNIAHGGITLDRNPEDLQRDHIFPKSRLEKDGYSYEMVNHYANFHFLRGVDNLNKLDKPPSEWFKSPGRNVPPYSDKDLEERLLTWDDLQPGNFESMVDRRGKKIRENAEKLFGMTEPEFNASFADKDKPAKSESEVDNENGSDGEITEDDLLAVAKERGIAPLIEVCRRPAIDEWVWEQRGRGYGGSYRYWRKDLKDKPRVVFGIAVSAERFGTPEQELDVWMWPPVVSEVTNIPEEEIRNTLKSNFAYVERGRQQCSIRLQTVKDAERFISQLGQWFDHESKGETAASSV
jgi:hypothetical protein